MITRHVFLRGRSFWANSAKMLMNFLNEPQSRLSPLIQPNAEQSRVGFPQARDGQSLPMYAAGKDLRLAHHSETRLGGAQGGSLKAIIRAEIRVAKIQMADRGGKRR